MKVFLSPVCRAYYRGSPSTSFQVEVPYAVCVASSGGANPTTEEGVMVLTVLDDLSNLYPQIWTEIQRLCAVNGWGDVYKQDVFLHIPTPFDTVSP
jgi:hypothetical protein